MEMLEISTVEKAGDKIQAQTHYLLKFGSSSALATHI